MAITTIFHLLKKKKKSRKKKKKNTIKRGGEPHPTQTNPQIVTMVCLLQDWVWELAKMFFFV